MLSLGVWIVRLVRDCLFELNGRKVSAISPFRLLDELNLHPGRVSTPQCLQSDDGANVWLKLVQVRSACLRTRLSLVVVLGLEIGENG